MPIRVGIDTGGTFTDLVAVDEDGRSFLAKVPSNPDDPVATVAAALRDAGFEPAEVEMVVVGTTIGINAVLTRRGARVVYLTTEGFEDVLEGLQRAGLVQRRGERVAPTRRGLDLHNQIALAVL